VCVFSLWQQQHQATSSSSFFFSFFLLLTPCRVIERPFWSFFFPVAIIFAVQTFFSSFLWRVLSCRFIRPRSAARLFLYRPFLPSFYTLPSMIFRTAARPVCLGVPSGRLLRRRFHGV
jgi:hypothetical protein